MDVNVAKMSYHICHSQTTQCRLHRPTEAFLTLQSAVFFSHACHYKVLSNDRTASDFSQPGRLSLRYFSTYTVSIANGQTIRRPSRYITSVTYTPLPPFSSPNGMGRQKMEAKFKRERERDKMRSDIVTRKGNRQSDRIKWTRNDTHFFGL